MVSRKALLIGWLGVTGLTFFSALAFKSGSIEADVKERAIANLEAQKVGVPEVDVDGRHVELLGFVPSKAHQETALDVADDTYGALGPKNGLTVFSAAGGHFRAVKSGASVTLAGTVPSEAARDDLVALAADVAGGGDVVDQLTVFSTAEPWNGDVAGGLRAMSDMSSGQLFMSARGGSLVGVASSDAASAIEGFAPSGIADFDINVMRSDEADALRAELTAQTALLRDGETEVEGLRAELAAQTTLLADGQSELEGLRARAAELEQQRLAQAAMMATLQSDYDLAKSISDQQSAGFTSTLNAGRESMAEIEAERDRLAAELTAANSRADSMQMEMSVARVALEEKEGLVTQNSANVGALEAQVADLEAKLESTNAYKDLVVANVERLNAKLADTGSGQTMLMANLDEERSKADAAAAEVAALNAKIAAQDDSLGLLNKQASQAVAYKGLVAQSFDDLNGKIAALEAERTDLTDQLAARSEAVQVLETDKAAEIATLTAQLEKTADALKVEQEAAQSRIATLDGEVVALTEQLAERETALETFNVAQQSADDTVAEMQAKLDALEAERTTAIKDMQTAQIELENSIEARDSAIAEAQGKTAALENARKELSDLGERNMSLTAELADLQSRSSGFQSEMATLVATIAANEAAAVDAQAEAEQYRTQLMAANTASEETDDLRATVAELEATLAANAQAKDAAQNELQLAIAERDDATAQLDSTNEQLSVAIAAKATAEQDLASLEATTQQAGVALDDMKAQLDDALALKTSALAEASGTAASLEDMRAALKAAEDENAEISANLAGLQSRATNMDAEIATLNAQIGEANTASTELEAQLTAARDSAIADRDALRVELDGLKASVETASAQEARLIAELDAVKAQSSEQGSELARLQGELDGVLSEKLAIEEQASQLQAASTGSQDLIAQKDAQLRALDGEASDLRLQLAALQNQLDQRPTFVAPTDDVRGAMINRCSETVNAQLEQSTVNFSTGTARLASDSRALLERISGMVLACGTEDVLVEIGGHTDAQGTDEDNMALSVARASAVRDFMIERGVPETTLEAVGFGETKPIADNETRAGRAANRRISLDWRLR